MKNCVWIDTSFIYALFVKSDKNQESAKRLWAAVVEKKIICLTSNLVTSELGTLLVYRFGHEIAFSRMKMVYDSSIIKRVHSTGEIENKAMILWKQYSDQKFSVTDCVSFECMNMFGIKKILTFDIDFTIAGFTIVNNVDNLW